MNHCFKTDSFDFHFNFAEKTDKGIQRDSNEDSVICCPDYGFFAVSDGMGSMIGGKEASRIMATILPEVAADLSKKIGNNKTPQNAADILNEYIKNISNDISSRGNINQFGATLSAVWLVGDSAIFINLGDSRGYILGYDGQLRQITKDHSFIALLLEDGDITAEEAENHPAKGQITRYLGMEPPALPDTFIEDIRQGDKLLLCTDGLSGMVDDNLLQKIMGSDKSTQDICDNLIKQAIENGGEDNISAIIVEINKD